MGNVKLSLSLVLFLVMTGCATGQLYNKELLPTLSADDEGRVFVYRTAIMGTGIRPDISVDGKIIGKAVAGGYFFADLPAGKHTLQVEQAVFTPKV
ncbi:MAG: DUF2846 domain-containing protein, partial [Pseudomonadales bacterium]